MAVPLPVIDLSDLSRAERESAARRMAVQEARHPFDLEHGPLLRAQLLKLDASCHILLLTFHHLVFDGWSEGVLIRELSTIYQSQVGRTTPPLPELPVQYADFTVWQRNEELESRREASLAYWREQLSHVPSRLELRTDFSPATARSLRGAVQRRVLDGRLAESLDDFSRREGATLFMTVLAAFTALLHRYTGQDDIAICAPVADRGAVELEPLIGLFVNTLIMRTSVSGDPAFRELLRRVRETALDALAHPYLPLHELTDELQLERGSNYRPLGQVMFQLRNTPQFSSPRGELRIDPFRVDRGVATVDLSFDISRTPEGLLCSAEYSTELFEAATIQRLLGHFHSLLNAAVSNPRQNVSRLPMLSRSERRELRGWSRTPSAAIPTQCVHQLIEERSRIRPDAIAIVAEDSQLTYGELSRRASQLARHLRGLGVGPEQRVGIYLDRSPEMVIAILGILQAGGAYVPWDRASPAERLAHMVHDSRPRAIVTSLDARPSLPATDAHVVCLDERSRAAEPPRDERPFDAAGHRDLAYVIYTSGSTGQPKGVMIDHGALANFVHAARELYELHEQDRVLQFAPVTFDTSVEEIFACLAAGATLVLRTDAMLCSPADFWTACRQMQLSVVSLPTAFWHELAHGPAGNGADVPECLRLVIIGGGPALGERLRQWRSRIGDRVTLMNTYGPTEATVAATACTLTGEAGLADGREPPIGVPIPNVLAYVLDEHRELVPIGVAGELYLGGAGLARGYLNRDDLTAERFVADPFREAPGGRLYRTGDLVRWRRDGQLEFLGRRDDQVKIRGHRVELGEIESVLSAAAIVREVAVVAGGADPYPPQLIAYVVTDEPQPAAELQLRDHLRSRLPEYMLPSDFVFLASLPRTPAGKLDRRALPAPDRAGRLAAAAFTPPRGETERRLAAIWCELLELPRVGIDDRFFELGGHSLLAARVVSRVRDQLGVELPLRQLFDTPTIAALAAIIDRGELDAADREPHTVEPAPDQPSSSLAGADRA